MPNQLNYGNPIVSFTKERMFRLSDAHQNAVEKGEKINLFGTSERNNIEIWFSNPDGTYAGDILLQVSDPDIGLVSVPHTDGQQYEFVILNWEKIIERADLKPGRYSVAVSLYRDEVSSATSENKLSIVEISTNRTEVRLQDLNDGSPLATEVYEFVVPSVPRIYAKALLDQMFYRSDATTIQPGEFIEIGNVNEFSNTAVSINLNKYTPNATERIIQARAAQSYINLLNEILRRTYFYSLDAMASDYDDPNVQKNEFSKYVSDALDQTLAEMEASDQFDPRFDFV